MALGEGIEALAFIPLASSCELIGKFMAAEDLHVLLRKAIGTKRWLWRLSGQRHACPLLCPWVARRLFRFSI